MSKHDPPTASAVTAEERATFDEMRARCLEASALITAAAELASPLAASPTVEKIQVLVRAAERSAEAALAAAEALLGHLDARIAGASTARS